MKEFDLEEGLEPVKRPKLTDFCSRCHLEVPRAVKLCPRCGFDIEGFRNLDIRIPSAPRPPVPAAPPPAKSRGGVVAVALIVAGGLAVWWTLRSRPEPHPTAPPTPTEFGYVRPGVLSHLQAEPPAAPVESVAREPSAREKHARPTASAPGAPELGRKVASATGTAAPPTPASYRVILTDGTIYDAVAPPGGGAMVTLRLTNGKSVIIYQADIDQRKTVLANAPQAAKP